MKCREINKNDFNKVGGLLCEVISQMNNQFKVPMKYNIDKIRAEFDSNIKDQLSIEFKQELIQIQIRQHSNSNLYIFIFNLN